MDDYKKISKITYKNQKKNIMTTKNSRIKQNSIFYTLVGEIYNPNSYGYKMIY